MHCTAPVTCLKLNYLRCSFSCLIGIDAHAVNRIAFQGLLPPFCFRLHNAVCIAPHIFLSGGIISDIIGYTWKELGSAPCGNPTRLKFARDSQYSRWLRGRILGQRGSGFNRDIPSETQSNRAFTLCQLHFPVWSNGALEIRFVFRQRRCRSTWFQ